MAFILSFSYPDGHVEEIDQSFTNLEAAIEYGNGLYSQVQATEDFKKQGIFSKRGKSYFLVEEVTLDARKLVFDSRNQ